VQATDLTRIPEFLSALDYADVDWDPLESSPRRAHRCTCTTARRTFPWPTRWNTSSIS